MPLIQGKSKEAFGKNIGAEVRAGKPERQAVAIAYSEKAKAEHKKHLAMGGKVAGCGYCMGGYAGGGLMLGHKHPNMMDKGGEIGGMEEDTGMDPDHEAMLDECAGECLDAIKTDDKMGFRDALKVLVADILNKHMEEDED
jgi:hypothetical protein